MPHGWSHSLLRLVASPPRPNPTIGKDWLGVRGAWDPWILARPRDLMVAAVAASYDQFLSDEDDRLAAAAARTNRSIYSLFDDEQDFSGLLSALEVG